MRSKVYEFFSKIGRFKRQAEWLPIFITRLFLGLFFILSGFFKLLDSKEHEKLLKTLQEAHIPMYEFFSHLIPWLELVCGMLIMIGFLTTLAALILFIILITALVTEGLSSLSSFRGMMIIEHFLYLRETLFSLLFLWLFFSGPGKVSLDSTFGKKRCGASYHSQ